MALSAEDFIRTTLRDVAARAARRVRPLIPSTTLQRSMLLELDPDTALGLFAAHITIPHYWAVYVHDGRGPISKRGKQGFLVFFKDPSEDPRLRNGYPVRTSQIRRLTRAQFHEGLRRNRAHLAAGGDPFDVPMIVVKAVRGTSPHRFFTEGLRGFLATDAAPTFRDGFRAWFLPQVVSETDTAVGEIG